MADIEDAINVVTDGANLAGADDGHTGFRAVNEKRAVRALRDRGAGRAEARELIREAVAENLGGRVEAQVQRAGRAAGPDATKLIEVFLVPTTAIRDS